MANLSISPSLSALFTQATSLLAKHGKEVPGVDDRFVTGLTPSFGEVELIQDKLSGAIRLQETESLAAFITFEPDGTPDTRSPRALEKASRVLAELEAVQ